MAVRKLEHVGVMVRDMDRSIVFYQEAVGLSLKDRLHTNGEVELAFLGFNHSNESEVELISGFKGQLGEEGIVHHIAFTVDDIEVEYARIRSLGVQNLDTEITTLPNGSRYFFFLGPDREKIEFFWSTR